MIKTSDFLMHYRLLGPACAGLVVLVIMICTSPGCLIYDEPFHLQPLYAGLTGGWSTAWNHSLSAAGPLYTGLHFLLRGITGLEPVGIRLVNLAFFAGTIGLTWKLLPSALATQALYLVALPPLWIFAGIGLTEMPAIFFLLLGVLLWKHTAPPEPAHPAWPFLLGSAFSFGLAIWGRQTFGVLLPAMALTACCFRSIRFRIVPELLLISLFPLALLIGWGSLVPPGQDHVGAGIDFFFFLPSLGYAGILLLIIAPSFPKKLMAACVLAALLGGMFVTPLLPKNLVIPLWSLTHHVHHPALTTPLVMAAFSGLAVYFLGRMALLLRSIADRPVTLFLWITVLLLVLSTVLISHQFSSRYIGVIGPFLLILFCQDITPVRSIPLLFRTAGILLGAVSLYGYYYGGSPA